jgi:hypothetical protein
MAKKEQCASSRRLVIIVFILLVCGGWWAWHSIAFTNWKDQILQYIDNRDIVTLEARFSPQQIIEAHRSELLGNDKRTLQNTILKYYPYLLLDVKYPDQAKTREGVLLWGLNDGEMVLNTETWEKTHGFRDCLECQATRSDFKILQALARRQGIMTSEELQKELQVEREILNSWIEGAKKKHLIVQKGNSWQLHFENPKLLVTPQTKIQQHLVSKPLGEGQKMAKTYSRGQIIEMTQAAFGADFKIRSEQEIFLPVYSLEILNPDESMQISEWNALTGQRISPHYLTRP